MSCMDVNQSGINHNHCTDLLMTSWSHSPTLLVKLPPKSGYEYAFSSQLSFTAQHVGWLLLTHNYNGVQTQRHYMYSAICYYTVAQQSENTSMIANLMICYFPYWYKFGTFLIDAVDDQWRCRLELISNCMVLCRQNKRCQKILQAKSQTFREARWKGFTVLLLSLLSTAWHDPWTRVCRYLLEITERWLHS